MIPAVVADDGRCRSDSPRGAQCRWLGWPPSGSAAVAVPPLTVQLDIHRSPYGGSAPSPLSDAAVMIGLGGLLPLGEDVTLEVAVTEDDGTGHSALDIGLHAAMRWRL